MSVKGLVESEKMSNAIQKKIIASLKVQQKELKDEITKIKYLLGDKQALTAWRTSIAGPERVLAMNSMLDDVEKLYLSAGDTTAAAIFKARMKGQLRRRLTNLKANELEVKIRAERIKAEIKSRVLTGMSDIRREAVIGELYGQSRKAGRFMVSAGRPFMPDLVTLETKAAGSKTLGKYMSNLFTTYENKLKDVFVKGIIRGDSYEKMEKNLIGSTNITAGKAKLLVRTEANAIFNESVRQTINNNPLVKGYRFRAVLDRRTSTICQKHDGEYIPKEKAVPGVNYPPLHPNCRSTVITVLYNQDERNDISQRYTKNGSNAWIPVPPGTTYNEYKQLFNEHIMHETTSEINNVAREVYIKPNDRRIITVGTTKVVPNVAASAALIDNTLSTKATPQLKAIYDRARRVEPTITEAMINIAETEKTKLAGLEFSVKTATSFEDKVYRKSTDIFKSVGINAPREEEIAGDLKDLVRYTVVADHNDIPKTTRTFMESLQSKGMEVIGLDNKYLDKDPVYKGVHLDCIYQGQKFEVQVHSSETLAVKDKSHMLFEQSRKLPKGDKLRKELESQMTTLAKGLPDPRGIEGLRSFRKK